MNTKQMKRSKPEGARLKKRTREQAKGPMDMHAPYWGLTLMYRNWLQRKGLVLLLAVLAFPIFGAATCWPAPQAPSVEEVPIARPLLGCDEFSVIRPGDHEVGDYLVKQYPYLTENDRVDAVDVAIFDKIVCAEGAQSTLCKDKAGEIVSSPTATLAPFEVLRWVGTANKYPPSTATRITVTPDRWGVYTVPMPNATWGPVSVAFRFNGSGTGADFRGTPVMTCRSRPLQEGREYWCHDKDSAKPRVCTDQAWGGDSPDPNYVGHPAGLWISGEGPSFSLDAPAFGLGGAFFVGDWFDEI